MPGRRQDSIASRDAGTAALRSFLFQRGWCLAFYLCYILLINSNSNRHVLLSFIETKLARLQIVLKSIWCWTDSCLLSRLQRRRKVVPAWIVVIAHWTTVSISTASRLFLASLLASLPVILSRRPGMF